MEIRQAQKKMKLCFVYMWYKQEDKFKMKRNQGEGLSETREAGVE